jgi:hypothetical protein
MMRLLTFGFTGILTVATFGLSSGSVLADHNDLAEAATNPLGSLIQLQLINQYNWETYSVGGVSGGYSNAFEVQPVIPFKLPFEFVPELITRTTVPLVTTPDFGPVGPDRTTSLGDTVMNLFGILNLGIKDLTIGVGPTFTFPTAGDTLTGADKWQAGPTFLAIATNVPHLQYGILAYQQWDFAGDSDRDSVSKLNLQPFITKHFEGGWYAGSQDIPWTYNFETDNWTMPLGPKVGRVFHIGKQPVNAFGAAYYSPLNDGASPKWTARVGLTFLFPE